MPANIHLNSGLGGGGDFRSAESCPVASQWAGGAYMGHQGGEDFLVADAQTRQGTAAARVVLWRCVHCHTLLVGIGEVTADPMDDNGFTWLESLPVPLLVASESAQGEGG